MRTVGGVIGQGAVITADAYLGTGGGTRLAGRGSQERGRPRGHSGLATFRRRRGGQ